MIDYVNQALEHKQGMARLDVPRKRLIALKRAVGVVFVIVAVVLLYSACHNEVTGRLLYYAVSGQKIGF
jgi:hypothetical protein